MKNVFIFIFPIFLNAEFILNGFGSLTFSHTDSEKKHYLYIDQDNTIDTGIDLESGSVFGVQGTLRTEHLTFIGQTIFRNSLDYNLYEPQLEWLFAKKDFTHNFRISIGRLRTPVYFNSQTLYVDYVRDTIKLPVELYSAVPFSYYDGIEFLYSKRIGSFFFKTLIGYSNIESQNIVGQVGIDNKPFKITINETKLISLSLESENFLIRGTYMNSKLTLNNRDIDILSDKIKSSGSTILINVLEDYNLDNTVAELYTVGFNYYLDNFILNGEWLKRISKSSMPDITSYYFVLSYNINDKLTPYISYANLKNIQKTDSRLENYYDPFARTYMLDFLDSYDILNGKDNSEDSYIIGVKYVLNQNVNLKFEAKQRDLKKIDEVFNMYNISLDFMF